MHESVDTAITIRLATVEDADIVSAITDAAYSKWIQLIGRKPEPMTVSYVDMIVANPTHILSVDSNPVGARADLEYRR